MAEYKDVVEKVMAQIKESNVEAVFGQSRQIGEQVIIPVAKISYGWGGGSGKGKSRGREEEGEGGGVGMGVKVLPIGYVKVTKDDTSFQPVVDLSKILSILIPVLGCVTLKSLKGRSKSGR